MIYLDNIHCKTCKHFDPYDKCTLFNLPRKWCIENEYNFHEEDIEETFDEKDFEIN